MNQTDTPTPLSRSFKCALDGLGVVYKTQRNAPIHAVATIAAISASVVLKISTVEWCVIVFACIGVWTAEALNTAIELLGDAVSAESHPIVGKAKDVAAGAVLLAAAAAVVAGLFVFIPRIF